MIVYGFLSNILIECLFQCRSVKRVIEEFTLFGLFIAIDHFVFDLRGFIARLQLTPGAGIC